MMPTRFGAACTAALVVMACLAVPTAAQQEADTASLPIVPSERMKTQFAPTDAPPVPSEEQLLRLAVATKPQYLRPAEDYRIAGAIDLLRRGSRDGAIQQWRAALRSLTDRMPDTDTTGLANYILYQTYVEADDQLRTFADELRWRHTQEQAAREYINRLVITRTDANAMAQGKVEIQMIELEKSYRRGNDPVERHFTRNFNKSQLDREIEDWEEELVELEAATAEVAARIQANLESRPQMLLAMNEVRDALRDAAAEIVNESRA